MNPPKLPKIPKNWRDRVLYWVARACEKFSISEATLGDIILGNPGIFPAIRSGRSCTVDTFIKIMNWLSLNVSKSHPVAKKPLGAPLKAPKTPSQVKKSLMKSNK